jgi:hypothetical protein
MDIGQLILETIFGTIGFPIIVLTVIFILRQLLKLIAKLNEYNE